MKSFNGNTCFFNFPLYKGHVTDIKLLDKCIINTINLYSFLVARKDKIFKQALLNGDILLPDGIGIVLASRLLNKEKIKKIAGADIHDQLLKELNRSAGTCFYLGSTNDTLIRIKKRLSNEFPNIIMDFYSPPFKCDFTDEDNRAIYDRVNSLNPDVLFVGMSAPKQEKWVYLNKNDLNAKIICSIGAVFDFYSGTISRPPKWLRMLGLEWFGRLLREPKRMWRRYLIGNTQFMLIILREKFFGN